MSQDLSLFLKTIDPIFYIFLAVSLPTALFLFLWFSSKKPKTVQQGSSAKKKESKSLIKSLSEGLGKTRAALGGGLDRLFHGEKKLDRELLESVHETLYKSDMGVATTDKLVKHLEQTASGQDVCTSEFVKETLSKKILEILRESKKTEEPLSKAPHIILIVGVNGAGKTTTIGKLASKFQEQGKSVAVCAGDTYRAAAIEQLKVWGDRLGVKVFAQQEGSDPAAVAFDSVKGAIARKTDVLIIDTAGRLHNKKDLMEELAKIKRAIQKECPSAPHETLMVLDATMGQNALGQVTAFSEFVEPTGLILTKLDGTAKGGVLVALADKFKIPVKFIGIGEKVSDLKPFNPEDYAKSLLG